MTEPQWTGYLTATGYASDIGDDTGLHTAVIRRSILAASRLIDRWTGRTFWLPEQPETRRFRADSRTRLCVGDYDDPTQLNVEVLTGSTWVPWEYDEDWQAEAEERSTGPFVRDLGEPWRYISTTTRVREFPVTGRRYNVKVTGPFGWPTVPAEVELACQYITGMGYDSKDQSGVTTGIDYVGREEVSADPVTMAMTLVKPLAVRGGTLWEPPPGMKECA